MKKNKSRTVISFILSILLAIFMTLLVILTITRFTMTSPSYLVNKLEDANYFTGSVETLNDRIQDSTQSTGFPLEMFENYVDENTATNAIKTYITNALNGEATIIDTTEFENKLNSDVDTYLTQNNIIVNTEEQEAVNAMKSDIINDYQSYMSFPAVTTIASIIAMFNHYYLIIAAVLLVLIIFSSVILYRLYHHYYYRRRFFSYSILASGWMCFIIPALLYIGGFVNRLSLTPQYFYSFVTTLLNSYLLMFIYVGIILIVLGSIFAYIKFERK